MIDNVRLKVRTVHWLILEEYVHVSGIIFYTHTFIDYIMHNFKAEIARQTLSNLKMHLTVNKFSTFGTHFRYFNF